MGLIQLQSVALELTNHCNLNCSICWSQNPVLYPPRDAGFMKLTLFKSIIDQLAADPDIQRVKPWLSLSYGGESLLHPQFKELLEYASSKGIFRLQLITNGILLKQHIPLLIQHKVMTTISYHMHDPKTRKTVDHNIRKLLSMRGGLPVNVAVVGAEAAGLYASAKTKFKDIVYDYPLITEDLKYADGTKPAEFFCQFPFTNMAVLWNGDVWPCCRLLSSDFPSLGNLNYSSVVQVWNGSLFDAVRSGGEGYPCEHCEVY